MPYFVFSVRPFAQIEKLAEFVAFKEATGQQFSWNYDKFKGTTASAQAQDIQNYLLGTSAMGDPRSSPSNSVARRTCDRLSRAATRSGRCATSPRGASVSTTPPRFWI